MKPWWDSVLPSSNGGHQSVCGRPTDSGRHANSTQTDQLDSPAVRCQRWPLNRSASPLKVAAPHPEQGQRSEDSVCSADPPKTELWNVEFRNRCAPQLELSSIFKALTQESDWRLSVSVPPSPVWSPELSVWALNWNKAKCFCWKPGFLTWKLLF